MKTYKIHLEFFEFTSFTDDWYELHYKYIDSFEKRDYIIKDYEKLSEDAIDDELRCYIANRIIEDKDFEDFEIGSLIFTYEEIHSDDIYTLHSIAMI